MKKLSILFFLILALKSQAQTDTAKSAITVQLPVKAIVMHGYYMSLTPNWDDRKAPDALQAIIGSGTQPDSLVTLTMTAGKLANLMIQLNGDRYGVLANVNRSIFNNLPAITGYTGLLSQVNTKAAGTGAQKDAATYVKNRYNAYQTALDNLYTDAYNTGLNWIRN